MDEHGKLVRAQRQVGVIIGFYIHLATFVVVMALPFTIGRTASGGCNGHFLGGAYSCSRTPCSSFDHDPTNQASSRPGG